MGRRSRPHAVGYVRVAASEALADPLAFDTGGLGASDQRLAIARAAARVGLDLVEIIEEAPAEADDVVARTGFPELLERARDLDAHAVVVARLDRLAPGIVLQELFLAEVERAGLTLHSAQAADEEHIARPDATRAVVREAVRAVRPFDGDLRAARARWRRRHARGDEALLAELEHLAEQGADRGALVGLLRRLRAAGESSAGS